MKYYTTEEINEIILNKNVEDFYFVILQIRRDALLTADELEESNSLSNTIRETKRKLDSMVSVCCMIYGNMTEAEMREYLYSQAAINYMAVIIKLNDNLLYDCKNMEYVDLDKTMVVDYANANCYYDNDNARAGLVTPEENENLTKAVATLRMDDLSEYEEYKKRAYTADYTSEDLTDEFVKEIGLSENYSRIRNQKRDDDALSY